METAEMIASAFFVLTTVLAITKLGFGIHENETFGGCLPYNWSCTVCYNTLKVSLLKRDDNVRKLSEAFFPPKTNEPEIVEVIYSFGEDKVNQQIWFWTHDSSYLFFPIETFQYLSLFFGKPAAYFSQKVHLTLDLECSDVDHSLLLLLTQRLKNFIQKAKFNPEIDDNYYARSRQDLRNSTGDILSDSTAKYILSFYIICFALTVAITALLMIIYKSTNKWDETLTSLSALTRANKYQQSKIISVTFTMFVINAYALALDIVAITNINQSDLEEPEVLDVIPKIVVCIDSVTLLFWVVHFTLGLCAFIPGCAIPSQDMTFCFFAISTVGPLHSMVIHLPYIFIAYLNDAAYATSIFIFYTITIFILFGSLDLTFGTCLQEIIDNDPPPGDHSGDDSCNSGSGGGTTGSGGGVGNGDLRNGGGTTGSSGGNTGGSGGGGGGGGGENRRAKITSCLKCRYLKPKTRTVLKFAVLIPIFTILIVILMGMVTAAIVVVPISRSLSDAPNHLLGFYQMAIILIGAYLFYDKFFKRKTTIESILKNRNKKIFDKDKKWDEKSDNDKLEKFYEHVIKIVANTDPEALNRIQKRRNSEQF